MSEQNEQNQPISSRMNPFSEPFRAFIPVGWAPYSDELPAPTPASVFTPARRTALSSAFPGERLVIPAGGLKQRSNDTDFPYRPHTAFAHLTGLGGDQEPDAVLVLEPTDAGHAATLYFSPRAPRTDAEFYSNARYGEMWVGQRESLAEMSALTGLDCAPISTLDDALAKNLGTIGLRVVREADAGLTSRLDVLRTEAGVSEVVQAEADTALELWLDASRLIKDEFEIEQMRHACAATAVGFAEVVKQLPEAIARGRGERWVEGVFGLHARHAGNAVGYETISAGGDHANTLHWIRNDGDIHPGDLLLLDAGVEVDSLYTADITRTLPVSGTFTPAQRKVYEAVLAAQEAGLAAAKPGNKFSDIHAASIRVIAEHLHEWGLLPVSVEQSLDPETGGHHRRWMVHGTSHHLGMDVHDCASLPPAEYREATLQPGMVLTVEPGLYFKATDLLVPEELRGIGVRIEDDILITETGNEILSHHLPRTPDAVEAWMATLLPRA